MSDIKTAKTIEREARDKSIMERYKELETPKSQVTAICEKIAEEFNLKFSNVYRIVFKNRKLIAIALLTVIFSSCADVQPQLKQYTTGHEYGFWGGIWHGIISPISFFGQLFFDDIDMWAKNNNGNWYTFGFVLGAGILLGGSSKASK